MSYSTEQQAGAIAQPAPLAANRLPNWPYHPELLATPVPRYTSYPTAAEFTDDFEGGDLATALDRVADDDPVSLYLHIPYCREICWYCGCSTGAANRRARLETYLDTLLREIAMTGARLQGRGKIGRIAFGGGSPNAIAPEQFDLLIDAVRAAFSCREAVVSIEIDPRGFDANWARALHRNGVTRASLGVQTLAPHLQAAIGRVQPFEAIQEAMRLLRGAGVDSINFDLMYGLPNQTEEDLQDTLERSLALGPDRLAVFGYAHVPHIIARQRRIDATALPDGEARFAQADLAYRTLIAGGLVPVGFDHFARPADALALSAQRGTLRRNFQGFTEDGAEVLIGLGASAISAFPDRLLQNAKNTGQYRARIDEGAFAVARGVRRDAEDRTRGTIIEQLLTLGTAELPVGMNLASELERLAPFEQAGLIAIDGLSLRIPPSALPYARAIATIFDRHRTTSSVRFSAAI